MRKLLNEAIRLTAQDAHLRLSVTSSVSRAQPRRAMGSHMVEREHQGSSSKMDMADDGLVLALEVLPRPRRRLGARFRTTRCFGLIREHLSPSFDPPTKASPTTGSSSSHHHLPILLHLPFHLSSSLPYHLQSCASSPFSRPSPWPPSPCQQSRSRPPDWSPPATTSATSRGAARTRSMESVRTSRPKADRGARHL